MEPGAYTWDVVALDNDGNDVARRGKRSFKIRRGAVELPWIDPKELLRRVPQEHPRLLYPKSHLESIRSTLSTSRRDAWRELQSRAQKALSRGVPEFPTYHRLNDPVVQRLEYQKYFGYFRGYVNGALMDLALTYLMTQEARYAGAAKKILLEIASWPTADDDVTSVSAKWGDEAGLSFSKCAHLAYDWLYDALEERERALVFKMCRERAGQTYRRLQRSNYLTCPGESHNGRLIAYLTDMSLALAGETEEAETWLTYSLKALLMPYPHGAGNDGGWAEGTAYGLWYNTFYIPAFEGLRQLAGYDLWPRPFFKSSPSGRVSHSHADQNAFAIMKGGAALAIPSGHYGPSYGRPHHAEWTRATKANNCILVDGQGQTIRSAAAAGAIVDFQDAPGYSYVAGDATAATVEKSDTTRIAAVMAVHGNGERFQVRLSERDGWFGATASGDSGQMEGRIRLDEGGGTPPGFEGKVPDKAIRLCGRSRDGQIFWA